MFAQQRNRVLLRLGQRLEGVNYVVGSAFGAKCYSILAKKLSSLSFFSDVGSIPAHLCLEFRVFLINASTKQYTQEKRIISYWFKELFPEKQRAYAAQEFFKKLVSPVDFPRGK